MAGATNQWPSSCKDQPNVARLMGGVGVGLFQRFGSNELDRTRSFECLSLWLRWKSWLPHACLSQAPPTNQVKIMA